MPWNDLDTAEFKSEHHQEHATSHRSGGGLHTFQDSGILLLGLLMCLLTLGLVKAIYGLFCPTIGLCCLGFYTPVPGRKRKYYEPELERYDVIYDCAGWPIHPETLERNVLVMSRTKQFILNTIFFLTIPVAAVWSIINCIFLCDDDVSPENSPRKTGHGRKNDDLANDYEEDSARYYSPKTQQSLKQNRRSDHLVNSTQPIFKDCRAGVSKCDMGTSAPKCKCGDCVKPVAYSNLREFRDFYKDNYDDDTSSNSNSSDTQFVITEFNRSKLSIAQIQSALANSKWNSKSASN